MVLLKTVAMVALGVLGWLHRRNIVGVLTARPGDGRAFARLAVVEISIMGAATGLAAVLGAQRAAGARRPSRRPAGCSS